MADDHIRFHAVFFQHAHHRHIGRQHGRLGDLGILQFLFRLGKFLFGAVGIDETGKRLAQDRRHDPIGLIEGFLHHRFCIPQIVEHVHILRPLPGEEKSHLACRTAPAVDAVRLQGLPGTGGFRL